MENLIHDSPPEIFTWVVGHGRRATIWMAEKDVTAALAAFCESQVFQKLDHHAGANRG